MLPACQRLKGIEAALDAPDACLCDVKADVQWLVAQVRSWQQFATKVVALGDVINAAPIRDSQIANAYEKLFHVHQPRSRAI